MVYNFDIEKFCQMDQLFIIRKKLDELIIGFILKGKDGS